MKNSFVLFLVILLTGACSSSQETQSEINKHEQEYYVFDNIEKIDSVDNEINSQNDKIHEAIEKEEVLNAKKDSTSYVKYIIQLGAFSTRERAESFVNENQDKISYMMSVIYNQTTKHFTVQLPPFKERSEAELVRNTLWKISAFKDAFIISE